MKKSFRKILFAILSLTCMISLLVSVTAFAGAADSVATPDVYMEAGAWVKVTGDNETGLRFSTKIKKSFYDEKKDAADTKEITCGTIIVPTDYVTAAGGYTFDKLRAYAEANEKQIGVVKASGFRNAATAETDGYYNFYGSIVGILETNYVRKFSGIGYMAVEKTDGAVDYFYADYSDADQSRSVYEVVKGTYSAQDDSTKTLVKGYLDAVVDITQSESGASIVQIEGYTSPYELEEKEEETTIGFLTVSKTLNVKGAENAKAYILNGEVQNDYTAGSAITVADAEIPVKVPDTLKNIEHNRAVATYTDGNDYIDVTLSKNVGTWTFTNDSIDTYPTDMSYVAISGSNFGLNDLISVDFEGNYMPVLGLYANGDLSGLVGNETNNGYMLFNGANRWVQEKSKNIEMYNGVAGSTDSTLYVFGGNRVENKIGDGFGDRMYREKNSSYAANSLDRNKAYRVIAGLIENADGKVDLLVYLFERAENGALTFVAKTTGDVNGFTKIKATDFNRTGKLVVYGSIKEAETKIRFTNKAAKYVVASDEVVTYDETAKTQTINVSGAKGYLIADGNGGIKEFTNNAVISAPQDTYLQFYAITDGDVTKYTHIGKYAIHNGTVDYDTKTVTLNGGGVKSGSFADISAFDNAYFAFTEQFGTNSGIDFWFKGNNMPQVCFFADMLTGNMTSGGGKGVLFMNGFCLESGDYVPLYTQGYNANEWYIIAGVDKLDANNAYCYAASRDHLIGSVFTAAALDADKDYRYTIMITQKHIVLKLFEVATDGTETQVGSSQWIQYIDNQKVSLAEIKDMMGYIVCYAGVKGNGNNTTFTYLEPYKCNNDGVKIN